MTDRRRIDPATLATARAALAEMRAARREDRAPPEVRQRLIEHVRALAEAGAASEVRRPRQAPGDALEGRSGESQPPGPSPVERWSSPIEDVAPLHSTWLSEQGLLAAQRRPLLARAAGAVLMVGLVVLVLRDVRRPMRATLGIPKASDQLAEHAPPPAQRAAAATATVDSELCAAGAPGDLRSSSDDPTRPPDTARRASDAARSASDAARSASDAARSASDAARSASDAARYASDASDAARASPTLASALLEAVAEPRPAEPFAQPAQSSVLAPPFVQPAQPFVPAEPFAPPAEAFALAAEVFAQPTQASQRPDLAAAVERSLGLIGERAHRAAPTRLDPDPREPRHAAGESRAPEPRAERADLARAESLAESLRGAFGASAPGAAPRPSAGVVSPSTALRALRSLALAELANEAVYPEGTSITARGNVAPERGRNLISNGDFSRGDAMWSVQSWRGFGATSVAPYYSVKTGALCTTLEPDQEVFGGWPWDEHRRTPSSFELERGKRYRLSLRVWSSSPEASRLIIKMGHQREPFTPALVASVPVGSEPGRFDIDFVAERHDSLVGLSFVAAGTSGSVPSELCLDDVSLRPLGVAPPSPPGGRRPAAPASRAPSETGAHSLDEP